MATTRTRVRKTVTIRTKVTRTKHKINIPIEALLAALDLSPEQAVKALRDLIAKVL